MSITWHDVIWPATDIDRQAWEMAKSEVNPSAYATSEALLKYVIRRASEIKKVLLCNVRESSNQAK